MNTPPPLPVDATPASPPPPDVLAPAEAASPAFAGFWRRVLAFVVDGLVIGGAALVIGLVFGVTLSSMGGWERMIGFAIVLAYSGLLNSRLGAGQTLGKRLLGLRVVGLDGTTLPVPRALARQTVFSLPVFLNGAPFPVEVILSPVWGLLLSVIVFGGLFAIGYLFVFNRRTRRSLHDLAIGSMVVRAGAATPAPIPATWRGHLVVIAVFAAVAAVAPFVVQRLVDPGLMNELLPLQAAMSAEPGVVHAAASIGTAWQGGGQTSSYVTVVLRLDQPRVDDEERARAVAQRILAVYPGAKEKDRVAITFIHGFDMVVASAWRSHSFAFSPDELEARSGE